MHMAARKKKGVLDIYLDKMGALSNDGVSEEESVSPASTVSKTSKTENALLTNEALENALKVQLQNESYAYNAGVKPSLEGWRQSAVSGEARDVAEKAQSEAGRAYFDGRARAIRGAYGRSGYGLYVANQREKSYRAALEEAAEALAEAYGDFYEKGEDDASLSARMNVINYMTTNRLNERESILYALAAGFSYDEAVETARGAAVLLNKLNEKYHFNGTEE